MLFLLFTILIVVAHVILKGFVLTQLWTWFLMPLSAQIPSIEFINAVGLSLLISVLVGATSNDKQFESKDDTEKIKYLSSEAIGKPLTALFIGYILSGLI